MSKLREMKPQGLNHGGLPFVELMRGGDLCLTGRAARRARAKINQADETRERLKAVRAVSRKAKKGKGKP
jgi:hypothetical protein